MDNDKIKTIKDTIYGQLCDNIQDDDGNLTVANSIYDDVENLHKEILLQTKRENISFKEKISKLNDEIDERNSQIDQILKNQENEKIARKNLFLLRQFINYIFTRLWKKYVPTESKQMEDELKQCIQNEHLLKFDGYKFAIAIKSKKILIENFPTELCDYHINLNGVFHPKIIPMDGTIEKIKKIKNHIESNNSIQEYISTGTTKDIIEKTLQLSYNL